MATLFGDWLRETRKAKGLSANQVALAAEISRNYMSVLELGKQPPTDWVMERLAPVLDVPLEEMKKAALRDRMTPDELRAAAFAAIDDQVVLIDEIDQYLHPGAAAGLSEQVRKDLAIAKTVELMQQMTPEQRLMVLKDVERRVGKRRTKETGK